MGKDARQNGRRVGDVWTILGTTGHLLPVEEGARARSLPPKAGVGLAKDEQRLIDEIKAIYPHIAIAEFRACCRRKGAYVSASAVYVHLKKPGQVEAPLSGERRPGSTRAMKSENETSCGGGDWTKLSIGHVPWYLLRVIDWFSWLLIAFDVVPALNASHVKAVYQQGLRAQGILRSAGQKPDLRVDRSSPNTSWGMTEFFQDLEADLSFARVRRPTDNAIMERLYGGIKQEEIYLGGNYPDERSAREEIERYIVY